MTQQQDVVVLFDKEVAELTARATIEGLNITVLLTGTADSRVAAQLMELLTSVHQEAQKRKTQEVVVDFRGLEFMNSSCFKAFVSWIAKVQDLDAALQYRIHFRSDNRKHWQRRSLSALSCFAVDLIRIDS